jgi:hydrogenase expression/formation protein HypC
MCLGLVGQVRSLDATRPGIAMVELGDGLKPVNIAMLDEPPAIGAWVSVHLGLAMETLTPEEAEGWLEVVRMMGPPDGDLDTPTWAAEAGR